MIYFLIPKTHYLTYIKLDLQESDNDIKVFISNSLSYYLSNIKEKINIHEKEWDVYKKYTNPYEYIHTILPNKKRSISKYKPLSRSYFKMIEIMYIFKLLRNHGTYNEDSLNRQIYINNDTNDPLYSIPIKTFHLCEGPGGFIEAIVEIRKNPQDTYIGMTILDDKDDYNIPSWKKSDVFLRENSNVSIENGKDGTGNILNVDNFIYCKEKYHSSMDFITGDGGFDFSMDFNNQEINMSRLLFAQIAYALCMQKMGGSFVLKIFDSFMLHTIDMVYLLSSFYEKVYITKPQTSRYANSEKYVVCKNFLFSSCDEFYPFLLGVFIKMTKSNKNISRFLSIPISNYFLTKMEEFNSIFGQQQIENIYYTISLIETKNKTDKIEHLIRNNIQKCVQWCIKYGVSYNQITNINVFLTRGSVVGK